MPKTSALKARLPLVLSALLLAAVLFAALLRRTQPTQPLAPAQKVVLLLAPGCSLSDWTEREKAPALAALTSAFPHGVFPTRTDETPATLEDPLVSAAHMIATGDRMPPHLPPTLAQVCRRSHVALITLANEDSAARTVVGLSRPDPLTIDQPKWRAADPGFPDGLVTDPDAFSRAIATAAEDPRWPRDNAQPSAQLIVATFDDLYRADQYAPLALSAATRLQRAQALGRLDRVAADLTSPQSPERLAGSVWLVLISPTASGDALARNERLGPILLWSPDAEGSANRLLLTSPSTRATPGLLAGTDLAATIASLLGLPLSRQHIGEGRAARLVADDGRLESRIRGWSAQAGEQRLLIYIPWILGAILLGAGWAATRRYRLAATVGSAAAFFPAALLIAAFVVPVNSASFLVYVIAALPCVVIVALASVQKFRGESARHLLGLVGLATVVILTLDILTGSHLLARTPLSYSPMEAARFYGIGNESAGVLIGASLLAAAVFLEGFGIVTCAFALFASAICLTVALPQFGAKAGSLVGALAGFGTLYAARRSAARPRLAGAAAAIAVGAILLLAAFAIFDGMRGAESRTHVGEAMAAAHQHGIGALAAIATRKAAMDLHLMVTSPWAALLLVEASLCAYLWRRNSDRWTPSVRASMTAFIAAGAALLVFNDAGVVGGATCLLFAVAFALLPTPSDRGPHKQRD